MRGQFFIFTLALVILIIYNYYYNFGILVREAMNFYENYKNIGDIYKLESYGKQYYRIYLLLESTLYPFYAFYNCSYNSIKIRNDFGTNTIIVLDKYLNYLPTYVDSNSISFILQDKKVYDGNLCIFEGYIGINPIFNSSIYIQGNDVLYYYVYNNPIYIDKKFIENFLRESTLEFYIDPLDKCPYGKISNPTAIIKLNTYSIQEINLIRINSTSFYIVNYGRCPLDISNVYLLIDSTITKINPGINYYGPTIIPKNSSVIVSTYPNNLFCIFYYGIIKCA